MQIQKQTQPFVESEEFLILLSEDEQAIIAGGEGKHRKPESKHAKPTSLLRRVGFKVATRAIPVVGTALTIRDGAEIAGNLVSRYRGSRIHNEEGHWWSFL